MPTMLVAQDADASRAGLASLSHLFMEGKSIDSFAVGPGAVSFLSRVNAPLMLRAPNHMATMVLTQGYLIQFFAIIACAYLAQWVSRRNMVQWALLAAAGFT